MAAEGRPVAAVTLRGGMAAEGCNVTAGVMRCGVAAGGWAVVAVELCGGLTIRGPNPLCGDDRVRVDPSGGAHRSC